MNKVAFIWDPAALDGRGALRIEVDGRDLAEVVGEVERPYAEAEGSPGIAGGYEGISPSQLAGPVTEHFMGVPGSDLACGPEDKTVLLGCECGEVGCWPLMAEIEPQEHAVVWSAFCQPHRDWSYEAMRALTFERRAYEAALADAERAVPQRLGS